MSPLRCCHPEFFTLKSAGATNNQAVTNDNRRGRRPRGKGGNKGPQKSAAELDAEMEDYQKANE